MYRLEALLAMLFLIGFGLLVVVSSFLILFVTPAEAQPSCASRDLVVERLASRFGETPRSVGLGANGNVVKVFASAETGTWTIIVALPNGIACLVASGHAFEVLHENQTEPEGQPL